MAVDYGMAIGLRPRDLILALLITQFVGFPATLGFGKVGDWLGAKRGILIGLGGYLTITVGSLFVTRGRDFLILAIAVGLVQGGVQSLSRSLFARLVPKGRDTAYFGVYNMLGRFAAVLGPFLMGATAFLTKSPRLGILSVGVLFLGGTVFLLFVHENR
jgi:UMF1 family MFS transporter